MKSSRSLAPRLAFAALLLAFAAAAVAQEGGGPGGPPPRGGMGGPGGRRMGPPPALDRLPPLASLVTRPEVADEIALTDEQRAQLEPIVDAMRGGMRPPQGGPEGGEGDGPPPDDRGGPPQDGPGGRAARDKAEAAADAKIKAVLKEVQVKRLGEIQIQSMGLTAAMVPTVQTKLDLSDAQKAKLKALAPARRPGGGPDGPPPDGGQDGPPPDAQGGQGGQGGPPPDDRGGRGPGGGGPGGRRGGNDAQRRALETKIAAILTDDQKATLKTLGGKPFRLQRPGRGPGGGPEGEGGPGGPR